MTPMRNDFRRQFPSLILCGLLAAGGGVSHATEVTDAAAPFSALGTLRIQVIINPFLRLRVGTNNATINLLQFSPAAGVVGDNSLIVGAGGDAGGSTVNVRVQGNRNQITITPTNSSGGLGIGTGVVTDGRINYNQISTTSSDAANFPAPVLSNAGGAAVLPVMNAPGITNRTATWAYRYLNQTIPSAGTYGGVNLNGSRVTYTATMP
jgi:hypothetical protein